jgi:hypothetical protein
MLDEAIHLHKRAGVQQEIYSLPSPELSPLVLAPQTLGAASLQRLLTPLVQEIQLLTHAHAAPPIGPGRIILSAPLPHGIFLAELFSNFFHLPEFGEPGINAFQIRLHQLPVK